MTSCYKAHEVMYAGRTAEDTAATKSIFYLYKDILVSLQMESLENGVNT